MIFDENQTTLNDDIKSVTDRLIMYRNLLYSDLVKKLQILDTQRMTLITSYKEVTKEIDSDWPLWDESHALLRCIPMWIILAYVLVTLG